MDEQTVKIQQLFYGHVGVALLYCQLLEGTIQDIKSWPAAVEAGLSHEEISSLNKPQKETLGRTIYKLADMLDLDGSFESTLQLVLDKRNKFVHNYIKGKEEKLDTKENLIEYIGELCEFINELQEIIAIFNAFQRNYNDKHLPKQIVDAFGANRKDRNVDIRAEKWREHVPKLFSVELPHNEELIP